MNVEENLPKAKVLQVQVRRSIENYSCLYWSRLLASFLLFFLITQAWDPDTTKKMTYYIKQGPHDKFTIDSKTGEIRTTQGLEFEEAKQHILIVGLEENLSGNIGSTTTVILHVIDVNDVSHVISNSSLAAV